MASLPPAEVSIWSTLLPVIVGGLIGLAGGFIGPWFVQRYKEASEKREKRAEKFEGLVVALSEYEHWMDTVRDMRLYTKPDEIIPPLPPSPFVKLHAISAMYFPQFDEKILELERVGKQYEIWQIDARKKLVNAEKNYWSGFNDAYAPFSKVSRSLLGDLKAHAKSEF